MVGPWLQYDVARHAWRRDLTSAGTSDAKDSANRNSAAGRGADAPSVPDPAVPGGSGEMTFALAMWATRRTLVVGCTVVASAVAVPVGMAEAMTHHVLQGARPSLGRRAHAHRRLAALVSRTVPPFSTAYPGGACVRRAGWRGRTLGGCWSLRAPGPPTGVAGCASGFPGAPTSRRGGSTSTTLCFKRHRGASSSRGPGER